MAKSSSKILLFNSKLIHTHIKVVLFLQLEMVHFVRRSNKQILKSLQSLARKLAGCVTDQKQCCLEWCSTEYQLHHSYKSREHRKRYAPSIVVRYRPRVCAIRVARTRQWRLTTHCKDHIQNLAPFSPPYPRRFTRRVLAASQSHYLNAWNRLSLWWVSGLRSVVP